MIMFELLNKALGVDMAASLAEAAEAYDTSRHVKVSKSWQAVELNSADYAALRAETKTIDQVSPLWITYADSEAEADALVETLRCNGKRAVARPTPQRPATSFNPNALLHGPVPPDAVLSSGKTLQEHLESLAF